MATDKQQLGAFGEVLVTRRCACPKCKRRKTLRRLPTNFKCADLVCDFCGFLAQVKSKSVTDVSRLPATLLGGAWSVQRERMDAGIYFPLFIVLVASPRRSAVYYLSADLQTRQMFVARRPLAKAARRAGWQGYYVDLTHMADRCIVRLS